MDVLISGLNSYIGRRAAGRLATHDFRVYGLVRDARLFETTGFEPVTATLFNVDLLRKGDTDGDFPFKQLDMGICFTPSTDLSDRVSLQVELTRLKNFIELLQSKSCNRILYIARLMDKGYVQYIEQLFENYQVDYTVVLTNIALGKQSLADRYFRQLLQEKYVWYDEALGDVEFRPLGALDVLRWIRSIQWPDTFVRQRVELGGVRQMSVRELFRLYKQLNKGSSIGVAVPHFIYNLFFRRKQKMLPDDDVLEIKRLFRYEYPLDNTTWARQISFSFTPLEDIILNDR